MTLPPPKFTKTWFWRRMIPLTAGGRYRKAQDVGYLVTWPVYPFDTYNMIVAHKTTRDILGYLKVSDSWGLFMEVSGGCLASAGEARTREDLLYRCVTTSGASVITKEDKAFDPALIMKNVARLAAAEVVDFL